MVSGDLKPWEIRPPKQHFPRFLWRNEAHSGLLLAGNATLTRRGMRGLIRRKSTQGAVCQASISLTARDGETVNSDTFLPPNLRGKQYVCVSAHVLRAVAAVLSRCWYRQRRFVESLEGHLLLELIATISNFANAWACMNLGTH